ncbi:MAG: hypothetical protein PHS49_07250 [Candidatus Gracilibacteria bacterium]|nr:hypothetical protein [Candidatus Gracilibacteria bacterium]
MIIFFTIFVLVLFIFIAGTLSGLETDYYTEKKDIMRIFSSFLSDIKVDKTDQKIDPINIENTQNNILYFSKRLIKIQKLYIYNKKIKKDFDKDEQEKKYIIEITKLFMDGLNDWLKYHKTELEQLTSNLGNQEKNTKNIDFKSAIELQKKRIEIHTSKI